VELTAVDMAGRQSPAAGIMQTLNPNPDPLTLSRRGDQTLNPAHSLGKVVLDFQGITLRPHGCPVAEPIACVLMRV